MSALIYMFWSVPGGLMLGGTEVVLASLVQVARLLHASWFNLVFASVLQMARGPYASWF